MNDGKYMSVKELEHIISKTSISNTIISKKPCHENYIHLKKDQYYIVMIYNDYHKTLYRIDEYEVQGKTAVCLFIWQCFKEGKQHSIFWKRMEALMQKRLKGKK